MPLNEFQKDFKGIMLRPLSQVDEAASQFKDNFVNDHIPVNERLKIYHNNVLGSLSKNILTTYPLLEALVGENFLKTLAREFVMENPPQSACLHYYGEEFDIFLKKHASTQSMPYLSDVATLEWALHKAYHAADDSPMSTDDFSAIEPDSLADTTLTLRGSLSLIASPYPLQAIRDMCLKKTEDAPDMTIDHNTRIMVWRQKLEVNILPLEDDEFMMLSEIKKDKSLGEAVENTLNAYPDFDFAAFLKKNIIFETFSKAHSNN
ncbi:MAG: putative DNA-binding domain-containing protein [Alphaproteobacteria bacterium]|nr:putative DNA-binding domain-containing protein [Alphaproteobacteria bacterium]